jgi:hypothetical protein
VGIILLTAGYLEAIKAEQILCSIRILVFILLHKVEHASSNVYGRQGLYSGGALSTAHPI